MFGSSIFSGDISDWNLSSVEHYKDMFFDSDIAKKLGVKTPSFEQVKSHFLSLKLEAALQEVSPGQRQASKVRL